VYLALGPGTDFDTGTVDLRIIVQPLILWLWTGGALMFVGTFLAAFPGRRRRDPLDPVSAPVAELVEA
jgi:cytochrome c-type biogenesis protein CcmF